MNQPALRPYLWMLLGSFAFSWMGILAHDAGKTYDWQVIAVIRCAMPLIIVTGLALYNGTRLVFLRPPDLWLRSISGSLSLIGTFFVLPLLPAGDVFTVTNIFPIWVALLSWPMLGETPTGLVWVSILSGIAGVYLIQQPQLQAANYVVFVPLAVSVCTALAMIGLHRLRSIGTLAIVVHFHMVALAFALAAFFLFDRPKAVLAPDAWLILELIGVGLTATVGQLCLTLAFTYGQPAKVSVVVLTQIVFTYLLDSLVLGYPFDMTKLAGVPLVIAPTAWLMLRRRPAADG